MSYTQTFFLDKNEHVDMEWEDPRSYCMYGQRELENLLRRCGTYETESNRIVFTVKQAMQLLSALNKEIAQVMEVVDNTLYDFFTLRSGDAKADRVAMDSYVLLVNAQEKISDLELSFYNRFNHETPLRKMTEFASALAVIMRDYEPGDKLICKIL